MHPLVILATLALGARNDWAEGRSESDGATRDYYNRAGRLAWDHFLGDWRDARGEPQGDHPYATAMIARDLEGTFVEWDVTLLVREWTSGRFPNQGFFLRHVGGGGGCRFASREDPRQDWRPQLVITRGESRTAVAPEADTCLDPSTYRCLGQREELAVSERNRTLLRFPLETTAGDDEIESATLRLRVSGVFGAAPVAVGVFRCAQGHDRPDSKARAGIAAKYSVPRDLAGDPAVIFVGDFESDSWRAAWSRVAPEAALSIVDSDDERKFRPLSGKALRVKMAEGENTALNTVLKLRDPTGDEPERIYFRYYLRLADDWNQTLQGGKMPGISGTYGVAGWGGRPSDGTNGWSARGAFHPTIPEGNPLAGLHPIGTYCYHADMKGQYGDIWLWQEDYLGFLESNRWYCVEQYVRLNRPGENDGVLRAWIDGRLAFEKTDIRYRTVETLRIEQIWMNVYHGGKLPSPWDQHLYIDDVVVAREYIGPRPGSAR